MQLLVVSDEQTPSQVQKFPDNQPVSASGSCNSYPLVHHARHTVHMYECSLPWGRVGLMWGFIDAIGCLFWFVCRCLVLFLKNWSETNSCINDCKVFTWSIFPCSHETLLLVIWKTDHREGIMKNAFLTIGRRTFFVHSKSITAALCASDSLKGARQLQLCASPNERFDVLVVFWSLFVKSRQKCRKICRNIESLALSSLNSTSLQLFSDFQEGEVKHDVSSDVTK